MRSDVIQVFNLLAANANKNSSPIDVSQRIKISAQVIVPSGTITGSLQLQVSNDRAPGLNGFGFVPTNWSNLGSAVALSTTGVNLIAQQDMCYAWLRAVFTDSSGGTSTGKISVNLNVLGF